MGNVEIAVVGHGLAGSVAALALARSGRKVALIGPAKSGDDKRTTALMDQSIRFMDRLGLWHQIEPSAAGLKTMQIIDGTQRLLRAPPAQFRAAELGLAAFGYNIPNSVLSEVLERAIASEANIERRDTTVETAEPSADHVTLTLGDGEILTAALAVGADGRNSILRNSAGIDIRKWAYPQSAVVLNFAHELPHGNVSTEFHTETGPFTQVPLPGLRSSLVWVVTPQTAARLMALPLDELSLEVERRMQSILGKVEVEAGAQGWPLSGLMAKRFGRGRIALVGEAAHAFPPIGAQGFNLSLRDVMALADLVGNADGSAIAADTGDRFERRRRPDIMTRTFGVDLLNRSLLSDFLPMQLVRAGGLHLLSGIGPLRNLLMREGVEPGRGLRDLMTMFKPSWMRKRA
ncbi:UbiH/UbiF family hydroxylase [Neorhizobium sp. NPDC001467]|uniref:UbiH/UbiF family hydroxylase n=1 Tax=Neorhizobium sp. NPDC001467 TaxID=3390595 RepID=UPI003D058781